MYKHFHCGELSNYNILIYCKSLMVSFSVRIYHLMLLNFKKETTGLFAFTRTSKGPNATKV